MTDVSCQRTDDRGQNAEDRGQRTGINEVGSRYVEGKIFNCRFRFAD